MYEYRCTVIRVVDGDTLHLDVDLGFDQHTLMTVRLHGINAPENSTMAGKASTKAVEHWIKLAGPTCTLRTIKDRREKYGRYLGILLGTPTMSSLNDYLVQYEYAVPYDGGAR